MIASTLLVCAIETAEATCKIARRRKVQQFHLPNPAQIEVAFRPRKSESWVHMQMETKFLQLRTPVELGSWFGDWQVCWLGGWARFRLYYLVMLVKVPCVILRIDRTIDLAFGDKRVMNGVAMNTFTIDANNNITAFASLVEARAAKIHTADYFGSTQELAKLVGSWPRIRPVEIWNSVAGVAPFTALKPVKKFTDRNSAVTRIWDAVQVWLRTLRNRRPTSRPQRGSGRRTHRRASDATPRQLPRRIRSMWPVRAARKPR
jgi:hypothetical protein